MVEALSSTGPGSHNHEQNEDNHHKDNSGLLLRFSTNAGLTYYNNQTPRNTIPLDNSSPRRTLWAHPCRAACPWETFDGTSQENSNRSYPFHTCYRFNKSTKYCWTKSYKTWYHDNYNKCVPNCSDWWESVDQDDMQYVNPVTHPFSCGDPCQEMHRHSDTDPCSQRL